MDRFPGCTCEHDRAEMRAETASGRVSSLLPGIVQRRLIEDLIPAAYSEAFDASGLGADAADMVCIMRSEIIEILADVVSKLATTAESRND